MDNYFLVAERFLCMHTCIIRWEEVLSIAIQVHHLGSLLSSGDMQTISGGGKEGSTPGRLRKKR